jgi:hypothetical protein
MPNNRASSLTVSIINCPLCLFEGLLADVHSPLCRAGVIPENLIGTTSRTFPRISVLQLQRSVSDGHLLHDDFEAFRAIPQLRLYAFLHPHHQFLVTLFVP